MLVLLKGPTPSLNVKIESVAKEYPDALIIDLRQAEEANRLLEQVYNATEPVTVVTFNNIGASINLGGKNLWDSCKSGTARFINFLVDHPVNYLDELAVCPSGTEVVVIDRKHRDFLLNDVGFDKPVHFMPHGGYIPDVEWKDERSYDVAYMGSLYDYFMSATAPRIDFFEDGGKEFYNICGYVMSQNKNLECHECVDVYAEFKNMRLERSQKLKATLCLLVAVEHQIIRNERYRMLETLVSSGITVHVWGGDGKSLALKYPKEFIIHEYVSAQECENIMTDVKIVLNYSPRFADGAHDRVYGGMLAGAVCVTNPSEFLKEHFLDGEDIIYYDEKEPDVFVEKIKRLISDKAERERISHNAYEKVKGDTWGARVAELLKKR